MIKKFGELIGIYVLLLSKDLIKEPSIRRTKKNMVCSKSYKNRS